MTISNYVMLDVEWWLKNLMKSFNDIKQDHFEWEIFTDASESGWGACAKGQRTHGWWTEEDVNNHINFLELKAIYLGLKSLCNHVTDSNILIRSDNTTAISYINRMGSVKYPNLSDLTRLIWQWCELRNVWLFATYIPSTDNWMADKESRSLQPETEWTLSSKHFKKIVDRFGPPEFDLFASQHNKKCDRYASWHPDPEAAVIDAFTFCWGDTNFYAFPPFSMVLRTIQKIIRDQAKGILVVPYWKTQAWYPLFSKILIEKPILFTPKDNILFSSCRKQHPLSRSLSLVAGHVSGNLLK